MSKQRIGLILVVFISIFNLASAQDAPVYRKNAISFNLTRYAVNELNLSFEHRYSIRRGIEFNAGYIYINDAIQKIAKDWVNTQYFYERGFAARFHYKIFRKLNDDSKWRDYISPGVSYKYLYYNNQDFDNTKYDEKKDKNYIERVNQHRFRSKMSFEFLWGKVYEMNETFALEFYYGAGLTGTISDRYVNTITNIKEGQANEVITVNGHDKSFYVRPMVMVGFKFKISF
jgi:hypothetical protein